MAFLSLTNFQNILANMSILAILAFGQTFVIISAGIDLSTGYRDGHGRGGLGAGHDQHAAGSPIWLIVLVGTRW